MAERKVEEIYPRAPRYIIEIGDNQVVRFALSPRGSKAMHTRILDLSESGMAFLVPFLSAPNENEKIKMEFTAPNTESIACFARVTRVQVHKTYSQNQQPQSFKMVAVEFENLHPRQRQMLSMGLNAQFRKKHNEFKRQQLYLKARWTLVSLFEKAETLVKKIKSPVSRQQKDSSSSEIQNYSDKK